MTQADWNWNRIKYELTLKGWTLGTIAKCYELHEPFLTKAKNERSPAGQLIIALHIGVSPQEIWPSRYRNVEDNNLTLTEKRLVYCAENDRHAFANSGMAGAA